MTAAPTPAATEPFVARDLADFATDAEDIAVELECAANKLGDAYEDETDPGEACRAALILLRKAHTDLAALIAEVEAATDDHKGD